MVPTLTLVPHYTRPRPRPGLRRQANQPLAAIADRYAAALFNAEATGRPPSTSPRDPFEALQLLAEHSIYFNETFHETEGDPLCAAFDAGVAWGLALGRRAADAAIAGPLAARGPEAVIGNDRRALQKVGPS